MRLKCFNLQALFMPHAKMGGTETIPVLFRNRQPGMDPAFRRRTEQLPLVASHFIYFSFSCCQSADESKFRQGTGKVTLRTSLP